MKRVLVMLLSVMFLVGCQGCATTAKHGVSKVRVAVLDGNKVSVNGRVTPSSELGKAVKAAGASAATSIEVEIPTGAPQSLMVTITRDLRKAGYTKILFARPRQARVSS